MRDDSGIGTVVVGYGLAGRSFHCPLIRRQASAGLRLLGVVARNPEIRATAEAEQGVKGFASLDEALADPRTRLLVIATPHDSHAELAIRSLEAGRDCVVDKVMSLTSAEADRMIAARDRAGRVLSVFHNRRWDWDFLTLQSVLAGGRIGRPLLVESAVCRFSPPRTWRGRREAAGTILHDWGAHLVDQALRLGFGPCLRLTSWLTPAPWEGVDTFGHGRIVLEFAGVVVQVETSRVCRLDRPRWWVMGSEGGVVKYGVDPQEDALRAGNLDAADEPSAHRMELRSANSVGTVTDTPLDPVRGSWDGYYGNVAAHLQGHAALEVTAEQAREVVRILEAATRSGTDGQTVQGPWGG